MNATVQKFVSRLILMATFVGVLGLAPQLALAAQPESAAAAGAAPAHRGGEAALVVPDLSSVDFLGIDGHTLLLSGLFVCALGLLFGLMDWLLWPDQSLKMKRRQCRVSLAGLVPLLGRWWPAV